MKKIVCYKYVCTFFYKTKSNWRKTVKTLLCQLKDVDDELNKISKNISVNNLCKIKILKIHMHIYFKTKRD